MFKYLFCIILTIDSGAVYSQSQADTVVARVDTALVQVDSTLTTADSNEGTFDSIRTVEINEDSQYMPVKDSSYLSVFALRVTPQLKVNKYLADRDYEYANDPEYWKKDKIQNNPGSLLKFLSGKAVQWILFLGVLAIILYGIFMLAKENNFKWVSRNSNEDQIGRLEPVVNGSIDYDELIRKFHAEGNYRMAVRYMYLRLIHSAIGKNIIQVRDSMTNAEIMHAFGSHPLAGEFRFLATAYEYIFYGDFGLNQEIFDGLKNRFDAFQQNMST
jgi:hypothetical protein